MVSYVQTSDDIKMLKNLILELTKNHDFAIVVLDSQSKAPSLIAFNEFNGVCFCSVDKSHHDIAAAAEAYQDHGYQLLQAGHSDGFALNYQQQHIIDLPEYSGNYMVLAKQMRLGGDSVWDIHERWSVPTEYAKVLSLIVLLEDENTMVSETAQSRSQPQSLFKNTFYTPLSEQGFVLANVDKFTQLVAADTEDLFTEFTQTEIADQLFEHGAMVVSWGMTPYQYFIGFAEDYPSWLLTEKYKTSFTGHYKVDGAATELAFIRGELLEDYQTIRSSFGDFCKLTIPESYTPKQGFYHLKFTLYMVDEDSFGKGSSPVCFLLLESSEELVTETAPALNYDIFSMSFTS